MNRRPIVDWRSLTVQMVLSLTALVLLTAAAVGLPAIILIQSQAERQTWEQVNKGVQATQALYQAMQNNISDLATLTAQRPTLKRLLNEGEAATLTDYLRTLRMGTDLDLLQICASDGRPVATDGPSVETDLCGPASITGYYLLATGDTEQMWFMARNVIIDGERALGQVVSGIALDDEFARQMRKQTGLEHTILVNGEPLASSIAGGATSYSTGVQRPVDASLAGNTNAAELDLDGRPYYVSLMTDIDPAFTDAVALDVTDMVSAERRLVALLSFSILLVTLFGSLLGSYLARRVGTPLSRLAKSAQLFTTGRLDQSLYVEAKVREVSQLTQALENARISLQQSMTELRQAKLWTDNLLEAINEGIITLDKSGNITFFSPGAERIMGLRQEEVLDRHCDEVFRVADTDERFSRNLPPPDRQVKSAVVLADGRVATLSITGAHLDGPRLSRRE